MCDMGKTKVVNAFSASVSTEECHWKVALYHLQKVTATLAPDDWKKANMTSIFGKGKKGWVGAASMDLSGENHAWWIWWLSVIRWLPAIPFYSAPVHIWNIVSWFLAFQFMSEINILEWGQWKATKQVRGPDHTIYRQKLGKQGLFSHQKGRLRADSVAVNNYLMWRYKAVKQTQPDSEKHTGTGWEAEGTSCNTENSSYVYGKKVFTMRVA